MKKPSDQSDIQNLTAIVKSKESEVPKKSNSMTNTEEEYRKNHRRSDLSDSDNYTYLNLLVALGKYRTYKGMKISINPKKNDVVMTVTCMIKNDGFMDALDMIKISKNQDEIDSKYRVKFTSSGNVVFYIPTEGASDEVLKYIKPNFEQRAKMSASLRDAIKEKYNSIVGVDKILSPKRISTVMIARILRILIENFNFETKSVNIKVYDEKPESFYLIVSDFIGEVDITLLCEKFAGDVRILYNPIKAKIAFFVLFDKFCGSSVTKYGRNKRGRVEFDSKLSGCPKNDFVPIERISA